MRGNAMSSVSSQRGAVLIVALLLLTIMTLIGITAMNRTVLEERMAGNLSDRNLAFQAAESGLRDGGEWVQGFLTRPAASDDGSTGIWSAGTVGADAGEYTFDWDAKGLVYGDKTGHPVTDFVPEPPDFIHAEAPVYVVEETAFVPDGLDPEAKAKGLGVLYYTISSLGKGGSDTAESVVQTVYEKRFN